MKSEQQQHVEGHRKVALRRRLLSHAGAGAAYVPFIGDGDLAVELYQGRDIFGADRDPARVDTAKSRLPTAMVIKADCDRWPFPGRDLPPIALADFDAYAYPYDSFRAFWQHAPKASRLVLFFTDAQHFAFKRSPSFRLPDGTKRRRKDLPLSEQRALDNFYWTKVLKPWLAGAVAPYRVVETAHYLRKDMLYWGCVIDAPGAHAELPASDKPETPVTPDKPYDPTRVHEHPPLRDRYKFTDRRVEQLLDHLANGLRRGKALAAIGISRQTFAVRMREDEHFARRVEQAEMAAHEAVEDALFEAAKAGNVNAQVFYLKNRLPDRWRDIIRQQLAGHQDGPLEIAGATLADLNARAAEMTQEEAVRVLQEMANEHGVTITFTRGEDRLEIPSPSHCLPGGSAGG